MKRIPFFLLLFLIVFSSWAKKKDPAEEVFLIEGQIFETDIFKGDKKPASGVQIVIYQGIDIFVAFYSDELGNYEFLLPTGHVYEIWYGGSAFVNKRVSIDAQECPKRKSTNDLLLDIGLFRPMDGYEFAPLNDAYVKLAWNDELEEFSVDMLYTGAKEKELEKIFKKIKKANPKGNG